MEHIYIGKLGKSFGLDGFLRVTLESGTEDIWSTILQEDKAVFVGILDFKIPFFIEEFDSNKNLIKFQKISTEGQFKELISQNIYVESTPEFQAQKFDAEVFNEMTLIDAETQKVIGKIIRIEEFPAHPMAIVSIGDNEVMVPLVEEWIVDLNIKKNEVTMVLPEGLIG